MAGVAYFIGLSFGVVLGLVLVAAMVGGLWFGVPYVLSRIIPGT